MIPVHGGVLLAGVAVVAALALMGNPIALWYLTLIIIEMIRRKR